MILTIIPILVLFLFLQRYIYNGFTSGATKSLSASKSPALKSAKPSFIRSTSASVIRPSGTGSSYVECASMDGAFFLGFLLILFLIFAAIWKYHPVSGAEVLDWKPTRSPEVEAELELDDVDQMLEAQNERRRASGRPERTEDDVSMQVQEDRQFIDDYAERVKREDEERGDSSTT